MFTLKGKIRGDLWIQVSFTLSTLTVSRTVFLFQIYEGEATKTKDNTFLGAFALEDITSSFWSSLWCPTKLKITFEIGIDGILTAKAEDKSPNNKASSSSMIVTNQHNRFTKAELADMVDEAKKLKREDEFRRKCVATRIGLEDYCFHLKNLANELLNTVPEDNRQKVYKKCDEVLAWIDDNQFAATEELEYQQMELMNVGVTFIFPN
uniref:Heat shock protein 70 family n=1 Tax=Panagrellus redivivus TaxID=6233 RepID=A0A7E4UVV0_PANRE